MTMLAKVQEIRKKTNALIISRCDDVTGKYGKTFFFEKFGKRSWKFAVVSLLFATPPFKGSPILIISEYVSGWEGPAFPLRQVLSSPNSSPIEVQFSTNSELEVHWFWSGVKILSTYMFMV